jgi:hypothetical protein
MAGERGNTSLEMRRLGGGLFNYVIARVNFERAAASYSS